MPSTPRRPPSRELGFGSSGRGCCEPGDGSRSFPTSFLPSSSSSSLVSLFLCLFFFSSFFSLGPDTDVSVSLSNCLHISEQQESGMRSRRARETAAGGGAPASRTPCPGQGTRTRMAQAPGRDGAGRGVASCSSAPIPSPPTLSQPREASSWDGVNQGFPGAENRNR